MNNLIIYETPSGHIYAAIDGEEDRWDMQQRVRRCGAGVPDIYAFWDGAHDDNEIRHE